ncbi:MAG TPA: DegV family protein [Anaerolineae bacterium]|nr:DegV family protein [Anaerolineae bacterium]
MPNIALLTDSSNDLPPDLLERHGVTVVPLHIHFGEETFPDAYDRREAFWARFAAGETPRTAAPSPAIFAEAYERALVQSDEALMITVTSKHSSTYQNALLAAEGFGNRVRVFDSWGISLAQGVLVLRAAQLIARGTQMDAVFAHLEEARARTRLMLYLDSLDAIQRSGRIAPVIHAARRMSSLLSVRILLTVKEGALTFAGAVRSPKKGVRHIARHFQGRRAESLAVAHTRAPELAQALADAIAPAMDFPRDAILMAEAGPVLGAHGGFRAFGVAFIER